MSNDNWLKIIAAVLRAIAEGLSPEEASKKIAKKFGVTKDSILNRL